MTIKKWIMAAAAAGIIAYSCCKSGERAEAGPGAAPASEATAKPEKKLEEKAEEPWARTERIGSLDLSGLTADIFSWESAYSPGKHKRYLQFGDEEIAGFGKGASKPCDPFFTADNGAVAYYLSFPAFPKGFSSLSQEQKKKWYDKRRRAIIIADPKNSRKTVLKPKEGLKFPFWHEFLVEYYQLSKDGRTLHFTTPDSTFYSLDLGSQKILYQDRGFVEGVSYDGSVAIMQNTGLSSYYRIDVGKKEKKIAWWRNRTRHNFRLSPDGNFSACRVQDFGPSYVSVYVHSEDRNFRIDHPSYGDRVNSVENDGTLHLATGTYRYADGNYVWATEGKEEPKGMVIKRGKDGFDKDY